MMVTTILALMVGGGLWASGFLDESLYEMGVIDNAETANAFKGRLNVLVMGEDTRKGEKVARADTIILASVDTEKNIISVLSIPRDTRVQIPGHGWEKINSATVYGGPSLATKLVSDLLGIKINNYVVTNYEGFKDIVDALGGVTMDVKERMYHHDPDDGGIYTIDIKPGVQRLDGDKALQFVRYRNYALGDIGRAEQQQKFLAALVKEALQPSTVLRLPSLIVSTYKAVDTNLSLAQMQKLAVAASKMNNANLITQTLPGKFLNIDDASYWEPDPRLARQVMVAMYEGRTLNQVILGETNIITNPEAAAQEGQKTTDGKVVPPAKPEGSGEVKTGSTGTVKKGSSGGTTGSTGQTSTSTGTQTKPGEVKKQPTGETKTTDNKTGVKPSQPSGGIVPPPASQDRQPVVIIVPRS